MSLDSVDPCTADITFVFVQQKNFPNILGDFNLWSPLNMAVLTITVAIVVIT